MKVCVRCGNALARSQFHAHCENKDGLQSRCKVCEREANGAYQRTPLGRVKHRLWSKHYGQTPKGRAARLRYRRRYQEQFPERLVAGRALHRALERGEVERQPCAVCGAEGAQAHHPNYSRPLDVDWLCPACHAPADAERRSQETALALGG